MEDLSNTLLGPFLYICYIALGLAVVLSILMPLLHAIKHPAGLVKSLIGVGGLVLLFVVAYSLSGSEVTTKAAALGENAASSKMIGAGMIMFYIILLVASIMAIYSLVRDIINP